MDIVCLSTRRIDNPMATIVQHLMAEMGRKHRVLFIEPPADLNFLTRNRRLWDRIGPVRIGAKFSLNRVGLVPFIPVILPFGERIPLLRALNRQLTIKQVHRAISRAGFHNPFLWVQSPQFSWMLDRIRVARVVYYITDEYSASPSLRISFSKADISARENKLIRRSSLVFVNSTALITSKRQKTKRIELLYSGVDIDHFAKALAPKTKIPNDMASIPKPVIGFIGALDRFKIDFELLEYLATCDPEISFVLIGPVGWSGDMHYHDFPQVPNLFHLGRKDYHNLPGYLKGFDVAIIPNARNPYTLPNFPMKLFEYFAAGKPVVASNLPSLEPFAELVYLANTRNEFRDSVFQALKNDSREMAKKRLAVAKKYSWPACASRVENILGTLD